MTRKHRGLSEPEHVGTGSPKNGEPVYLAIGRLGKPHGLDGGVIFYILSDFPERIKKGRQVFIGEDHYPATIESIKDHPRGYIIQFKELTTVEQIEIFKSSFVFVNAAELPPLPKGEYYHHQLIGLDVFYTNGIRVGILSDILSTGANDVYVIVDENKKEILYPALLNLIEKIDIESKLMVVKPMEYYNQD